MEVFVSGDQPIGICGVPPDKPRGGVVEKIMEGSQAGADIAEWKEKRADILAKEAEEKAAAEKDKRKVKTTEDLAPEQLKLKRKKQDMEEAMHQKRGSGK